MPSIARLLSLLLLLTALAAPARAGDDTFSLGHAGFQRSGVLHLPPRRDGPMPLVILLHGAGGSGEQALRHYGWREAADAQGFAVLAPDALPARIDKAPSLRRNPRFWDDGSTRGLRGKLDDAGFVMAAVELAAQRFRLDGQRLYAAGHSSGSGMAQRLGLDHADRIAAIAVVAGQRPPGGPPSRPLPVLYFAGAKDTLNPVAGGRRELPWGPPTTVPPLIESIDGWARFDGCAAPVRTEPQPKVTLTHWTHCRGGAEIAYYLIADIGHQWPGGSLKRPLRDGFSSTEMDATAMAWDFFRRHPLPPG